MKTRIALVLALVIVGIVTTAAVVERPRDAKRIHSFHVQATVGVGGAVPIINPAPGTNGFVITDAYFVLKSGSVPSHMRLRDMTNNQTVFQVAFSGGGIETHFETGIVVPAGAVVGFDTGTGALYAVTLSGYEF